MLIANCHNTFNQFSGEHEQIKLMIVRFDEILTSKYNKMDQTLFENEVRKAYETKVKVQ